MHYRNSSKSTQYLKWNKVGGQWTIAHQRGRTGSQLIMKEADFYLENRIIATSQKRILYCDVLARKFDKVQYVVKCNCGSVATCYQISPNVPQPIFLCESCGRQKKQTIVPNGTVCTDYADMFAVFPSRTMKDKALRNDVLRHVREAKGFRKYVTTRKSKKFLR